MQGNNFGMPKEELRLQSYLSHCGVASRRASEKIILDGRVTVNGEVVTELGTKVKITDEVTVDGKKIFLETKKLYVLLNKPIGYVCSNSDEKERECAVDLLKDKYKERLYSVGRLDMFSSGIIIFTNDGEFAKILSHPSSELEKEYIVETSSPLPEGVAEKFMRGIRVENVFYKAKSAEVLNSRKMKVVLIEGKNREIRRVFQSFNLGIKALVRVRIGNVLIENLKPGESRNLTEKEVNGLLRLCRKEEIK